MKDKYTISELSRFFNISDQTLRYYDKIGLYCPAYIDEIDTILLNNFIPCP